MTLEAITKFITDKNYLFRISIPNTDFRQGVISVTQAEVDSPTLLDYFKKIISNNNAKAINVQMYSKNGSSNKWRGEKLIFLTNDEAVATERETVATKTAPVINTNPELNGFNEMPRRSVEKPAMDVKDLIGYEVLKVRHENLEGIAAELKEKNKALEKKVDLLQDEKLELAKANVLNSEKNEFEIEKAKFEIQQNQTSGLSGLAEAIKENPELIKMGLAAFFPNNPAFQQGTGNVQNTPQIEAAAYHSDPKVNEMLKDLPNTIKDLHPKQISKIYYIFLEGFAAKPETINQVFAQLFPELAAKEIKT